MTVLDRQVTTTDFERFLQLPENEDRLFELIAGEIVEKMATEEHGVIALNIGALLRAFVKQHSLGRVGVEIRHQLPKDHYNSRLPDVSFTSGTRSVIRKGGLPQMPDLAVEIQSPDDSIKKMRNKANYYLANGTRLVWLVFPSKRYVEVYQLDSEMEVLFGDDQLDGVDVLPGFTMSVADVFDGV
jgi:Uma2 family endonuclease